jgi:hypothetical protein
LRPASISAFSPGQLALILGVFGPQQVLQKSERLDPLIVGELLDLRFDFR